MQRLPSTEFRRCCGTILFGDDRHGEKDARRFKIQFPGYAGGGYEIAGFVWWHGWNDFWSPTGEAHHEFKNGETYFLIGDALGKGMLKLLPK